MKRNTTFNSVYFTIAALIFITEVLIAMYVKDKIIRPYVGDVLVVIMIYCFIRTYFNASVMKVSMFVLAFAFTIEFFQYARLLNLLGWQHNKLARIVLGTKFEWIDVAAYVVGITIVIVVEYARSVRRIAR